MAQTRGAGPGGGGFARGRLIPRGHPISWWMLLVTTLAILVTSVDRAILFRVLPLIQEEFSLSNFQAGLLTSFTFVGITLGAIVLGVFGDAFGRGPRRAWTWGVAVLITIGASVATALSQTVGALQFWRIFLGVGTGGMEPVNVAMIGEWWQKENRGFAVGTHHTGFPLGQAFGPLVIGAIIGAVGWRGTFLLLPLLAIPIVILQIVIARRENLRLVNAWIVERGMTPSVEERELDRTSGDSPVSTASRALRVALANRNVRWAIVMTFCFLFAEFGIDTFLTGYLNSEVGIPIAAAIVVSGASGYIGWLGQIVWTTLSDTLGRKFCLGIIAVGWGIAVLSIIFITNLTTAWLILLGWGLVRNSPFPVAYSLLIDSIPEAASSGMGLMIGIALGVSAFVSSIAAGFVIDTFGYTANYIFLAIPCFLALIPISFMRETVVTGATTASGTP